VFVARGQAGPQRLVFLHGMCGHAQGYAQSFQYAAARWGRLLAPQADVPCGAGPWAKWSADLEGLESRLAQGFAAVGAPEAKAVVIGYSQGATRAEQLARDRPDRYTWLVSIAAPRAPSPQGLRHLKRAVMMAGERDRQDAMKSATAAFNHAGIPTTFIELPNATHGSMGATPELSMARAFDWIFTSEQDSAAGN
jgi:pimeloyl-ACP methyl ester carboxylesterase